MSSVRGVKSPSRIPSRAVPPRSLRRRSISTGEKPWDANVHLLVAVVADPSGSRSTIGSCAPPVRTVDRVGVRLAGSRRSGHSLSEIDLERTGSLRTLAVDRGFPARAFSGRAPLVRAKSSATLAAGHEPSARTTGNHTPPMWAAGSRTVVVLWLRWL